MRVLRHAARSLGRTPAFTAAAIATLALGIGAATAIFSLVNAALFKPIPYPDPEHLVVLTRGAGASAQSGQLFRFVKERAAALDAVAAQGLVTSFNLVTPDAAVHVRGLRVSTDFFRTHGVNPLAGREFSDAEDSPNGPEAVIISRALWQQLLGGQAARLGQAIRLGGVPHTVVGVMPEDFRTIPQADVLVPLRTTSRDTGVNYRVLGRLGPGATLAAAQAELAVIRQEAIRELGVEDERNVPQFAWMTYREVLGRGLRQPMMVLLGAVGFLLLIACVNVASLNVARTIARARELATYLALGAGRGRVLGHLFGESLIVALASGIAGVAAAAAGTRLLYLLVSDGFASELLSGASTALDWRVFVAAAAVTLSAAVFFGVAPAAVLSRVDSRAALEGSRATSGRHTARIRRTLAIAEMALAIVLLIGAGLLIRTFVNLTRVDTGFDPAGILIGRMSLQGTAAEEAGRRDALFEQALERIRRIPGVKIAAAANHVPVENGLNLPLRPPAGALIDRPRAVDWRYITPDYFGAFGIAMRSGRGFDATDRGTARPVAIVNEAFARTYFGRGDVLGQTIQLAPAMNDPAREIVGVVADVKARSNSGFTRGVNALAAETAPAIYVPAAQAPEAAVRIAHGFFPMKWIVKADAPLAQVEQGMRDALRAVDPTLPFIAFEPMSAAIADDLDLQRLLTVLMSAFAAAATLLAAIGLSGLIAYSAARRRREVGVRMALGATGPEIARAFVGEGLLVAGIGAGIGMTGAFFVSRVLAMVLHGVTPLDAATFASAAAVLVLVAAVAALLPAGIAARTDPSQALKAE